MQAQTQECNVPPPEPSGGPAILRLVPAPFAGDEEDESASSDQDGLRWTLTPTAERIFGVLRQVGHFGYMAAIVGAPGTGKTTAARQFEARYPDHTLFLTARRSTGGIGPTVTALGELVGSPRNYVRGMRTDIVRHLRIRSQWHGGPGAMRSVLVVDEAQYLTLEALEEVESIASDARAGLLLIGNPDTLRRTRMRGAGPSRDGRTWQADFNRFVSRCARRVMLDQPEPDDVLSVAKVWGVPASDEGALAALLEIASRPGGGGLRDVYFTLLHAERVAAAESSPITEALILDAWQASGKANGRVFE